MNERELDELEMAAMELLRYRDDPSDPHVEPLDDLARRRLLDGALSGFDGHAPCASHSTVARRRWLAAAAVALLVGGAVAVMLRGSPDNGDEAVRTPAESIASGTIPANGLDPMIDGSMDPVIDLPTGIRIAIGVGAHIRLERFDPEEIVVALNKGELVAALPPGRGAPPFVVNSPAGRIRVVGTIMRVDVSGRVLVDVLRGSVLVEDGVHQEPLLAGQRAILEEPGVLPIPDGITSAALDSARVAGLLDGIESTAKPGEEPGPCPEAGVLAAGSEPEPPPPAPRPSGPRPRREPTWEGLLELAGERRSARDWTGAAEAYREVVESFAGSPGERTALIALADIEISHLARPAAALERYERYLASWPRGALALEAMYGRALALGRLGRLAEEIAALESVVASFPDSPLATRARSRLETVGLPRGDSPD